MFIDALSDFSEEHLKGDICLIGAGAAGISIALEFANSDKKIILLESGGLEIEGDTQALYEGELIGRDYFPLDVTRLRFFGGSTNHWGGMVSPLLPMAFEKRAWVPLSGWPFGLQELDPYYHRASKVIELHDTNFETSWLEDQLAEERLPLSPAAFHSHLMRYSPPTRFGPTYHDHLRDAENITVVLNANVLELQANEAVDHLAQVKCGTLNGKAFTVAAEQFVLATGGLENPRMLLLSNRQQKNGLGNEHGLVGRYFMEHPQHSLGKIVPTVEGLGWSLYDGRRWRRKDGVRAAYQLMPSPEFQQSERVLSGNIEVFPNYGDWGEGLAGKSYKYVDLLGQYLRNYGIIGNKSYRSVFAIDRMVESCDVSISSEQAPNRESRILLSDEKDALGQNKAILDWRFTELDIQSLEKTTEALALQVGKTGIGRMQVDIQVGDWPASHHHMGTTRMSEDPRQGVVDTNCRLHGMDNFFIAGSSVFPTSGAVNPTMTIVALAIRLSDHLKGHMT